MGMKVFILMVKVVLDKVLEFVILVEVDFEECEKIYEWECVEVDVLLVEFVCGDVV